MRVTVEISLYPLHEDFVGPIRRFIEELRREPDLEVLTNQLSTQLRGEWPTVMAALARSMEQAWARGGPQVFVAKFVNADLPIASQPRL